MTAIPTRQMTKRIGDAEATAEVSTGTFVIYQGSDESEDEAIARAGITGRVRQIVIIKRFGMTAAECVAAARSQNNVSVEGV